MVFLCVFSRVPQNNCFCNYSYNNLGLKRIGIKAEAEFELKTYNSQFANKLTKVWSL